MATLTSVNIHIDVQDGVDNNSIASFQLYYINPSTTIASYSTGSINNNASFDHALNLVNNTLDKSQINSTVFYLQIDADGRDTFNGNLNVQFGFSDDSTASFQYGTFEIGTYHMSNSTRKAVQITLGEVQVS